MTAKITDYAGEAVDAARSVLLELTHLLQEYRDDIILIGGWVPELLARGGVPPHVGSMDVDLALDHRKLQAAGYKTIRRLLEERGYFQKPGVYPYKFFRAVTVPGRRVTVEVEVDLLAGEYDGTGRSRKHQRIQDDLQPRKARGCELAFDLPAAEVAVEGVLPEGGRDHVIVRVASIVPFLAMKGIALERRMKEKDAYDVVYCLRNYPGGHEAIAAAFRLHLNHNIVQEGLRAIAVKFATVDSVGPVWYAAFSEISDPEARATEERFAYELVREFLTIVQQAA